MDSLRWISWGDGGGAGLDIGLWCYNAPFGRLWLGCQGRPTVRVPEGWSVNELSANDVWWEPDRQKGVGRSVDGLLGGSDSGKAPDGV